MFLQRHFYVSSNRYNDAEMKLDGPRQFLGAIKQA